MEAVVDADDPLPALPEPSSPLPSDRSASSRTESPEDLAMVAVSAPPTLYSQYTYGGDPAAALQPAAKKRRIRKPNPEPERPLSRLPLPQLAQHAAEAVQLAAAASPPSSSVGPPPWHWSYSGPAAAAVPPPPPPRPPPPQASLAALAAAPA